MLQPLILMRFLPSYPRSYLHVENRRFIYLWNSETMSQPHILNPLNSLDFDIFPHFQNVLFFVWDRTKWWRSHGAPPLNGRYIQPSVTPILSFSALALSFSVSVDPGRWFFLSMRLTMILVDYPSLGTTKWKQKWVPLSSETRRTPESAPVRHHEFHLRSIWLNLFFKVIWSTY